MTNNLNFPDPKPTLPEFAQAINNLKQALIDCKGTKSGYRNRDVAARELAQMYSRLARYVDVASAGDAGIIQTSGYAVNRKKSKIYITDAPVMKRSKKLDLYGKIKIRWVPVADAALYIIRIYEPDKPGQVIARFESCKSSFVLSNLESGKKYMVRISARSRRGEGPMSHSILIWENWI